jgi:hypothetical protein
MPMCNNMLTNYIPFELIFSDTMDSIHMALRIIVLDLYLDLYTF